MTILYIVLGILMFGVLIAIHELGHFTAAKLCGVRVEEFAIGMGPAIIQKQKGETVYSLRAFPFGGYCAMTGEDGESDDDRAFVNQKWWKRIIILAAGSFNNFVLGLVIVLILYGTSATAFRVDYIADFMEGCPYEGEEMFMKGDRFYKIDGKRVYELSEVGEFLSNGRTEHDIVIIRDGKKLKLDSFRLVPTDYPDCENKMYGFLFSYKYVPTTPALVLSNSWETTMSFGRAVWSGLREIFGGEVSVGDLSGPVGIVDVIAETGEQSETVEDALFSIFHLSAFIAVNLAMMNMLPIPALDGGRIFFLLVTAVIEGITRKKLNPKYEAYIHAGGMILLLALMGFVMLNDIRKIIF